MSPSLSACFCLGLCLGRVIQAQPGLLPKPSLRAQPTSLVPWKTQVTLRCQGPPGVDLYRLENLWSGRYENKAVKVIPEMTQASAGLYRCSYQNASRWSPPSELLKLVVTGVYEKPTLTAQPSPAVSPGGDVTLRCHSKHGFDQYALYKTGDKGPNKGGDRWYQADFPIVTVTAAHSGTYYCYSFSSQEPYMWSAPSDPLELVVTEKGREGEREGKNHPCVVASCAPPPRPNPGTPVTPSGVPTGAPSAVTEPSRNNITIFTDRPISPTGISHQYYTKGNLVRICLGAVILIFLAGILAEDWYSRKKSLQYLDRAVHRPLPPLPQTQK